MNTQRTDHHSSEIEISQLGLLVADHVNAMLAYWDRNEICRFVNNTYVEWFGKSREEIVGKLKLKELLGQNYETSQPYIKNVLKGISQNFEKLLPHPSGEVRTVMANYYPDVQEGKVLGFFAHIVDITNVKKFQQEIAINESKFTSLLESTPDAVVIVNSQGTIKIVNRQCEKLFGYDRKDLLEKPIETLIPERYRDNLLAKNPGYFSQSATSEIGPVLLLSGLHKDGKEFPVELNISPIDLEDGPYVSATIRDITIRKEAEAKLAESENLYRYLYEFGNEMYISVSPKDGSILKCNETLCTTLGYTKKELIGRSVFELYYPEDVPKVKVAFENFLVDGLVKNEELRIQKKSGEVINILLNASAVKDSDGNILYSRASYIDITQENEAERKLKQLADIIESSGDAIISKTLNGTIITWNKGAEKILGYTAEEVKGKNISILFPPELLHEEGMLMKKIVEAGYIDQFQSLRVKKDKTRIDVSITLSLIKDKNGEIIAISKVLRDITMHKKAEQALNESRKQFEAFMAMLPAMAWIIDENGVYQYVNRQYANTFDNQELVGKSLNDLFPDESANRYRKYNKRVFKTNKTIETHESVVTAKGQKLELKVFKFPLGIRAGVKILGAIAVDISEIMNTEKKLTKTNEQLNTSNKELEQFAFVASHDLKEPLRMVSSFLKLLNKKYENSLDETARQYIGYAVDGAKRMDVLINDLLSFSKIGSNKIPNTRVDLNNTLQKIVYLYQSTITETNAKLTIHPLPEILASSFQMEQLFQNLIGNALKYRNEIHPEIEIGFSEKLKEWEFYVKDNGIGMDPVFSKKIFIIFQRLHNKSEYSGTGIGLAICKKIVEQHGGKIWAKSEIDKGSTFYFTIQKGKN
ncbi:hypothetical protein BH11BAC3_BH11BAC3_26610 [soil metagenome]